MNEINAYGGCIKVKSEDIGECVKPAWQLLIDQTISRFNPIEKAIVLDQCKYVVEQLEKEKENGAN